MGISTETLKTLYCSIFCLVGTSSHHLQIVTVLCNHCLKCHFYLQLSKCSKTRHKFLQLFSHFREKMDDGVAYMVMGEGGEGGQATQVVAVDNGDGTQQLVRIFLRQTDWFVNR